MCGNIHYEYALRGETLNQIKSLLETYYDHDPIFAAQTIYALMLEAGYMEDDEE